MSYNVFYIPKRNSSSNVKVGLLMKSVHKFNDFKISQVKNEICQKMGVEAKECLMTNLDFKNEPKIYSDDLVISNIATDSYSTFDHPQLLVYKLTP